MNCSTHKGQRAVAFCRECGRALCGPCCRPSRQTIYCEHCAGRLVRAESPRSPAAEPVQEAQRDQLEPETRTAPAAARLPAPHPGLLEGADAYDGPSPALAFILGLIPGVGAVYNGQYAKAVLQVLVLGGLLSVFGTSSASELRPLVVISTIVFLFYLPLDSLRTARALRRGETVDEFSGLFSLRSVARSSPVAGIVFVASGIIFLLHSLGFWRIRDVLPFWPVVLIVLGIYMVYQRVTARRREEESQLAADSRREGLSPSPAGGVSEAHLPTTNGPSSDTVGDRA